MGQEAIDRRDGQIVRTEHRPRLDVPNLQTLNSHSTNLRPATDTERRATTAFVMDMKDNLNGTFGNV
jgi:hypothetical protein